MTINQALKQKNLLAGKIVKIKSRIFDNNRWLKGEAPAYDSNELMKEYVAVSNELRDLKLRISIASVDILDVILEMAERKLFISQFKSLPIKAGKQISTYGGSSEPPVYEVGINEVERDKMIEDEEEKIKELQDKLDSYNATTQIS